MWKFCIALLALLIAGPTLAQQVTQGVPGVGQLPGTATNDGANAGNVGQYVAAGANGGAGATSAVTITLTSPAVVTWPSAQPFVFSGTGCAAIYFTTTGALPTGLAVNTTYYVDSASISGNTFKIATSCDNAIAGTDINASGSQSGTHSATPGALLSSLTQAVHAGARLSAGDWDAECASGFTATSTTSVQWTALSVSTSVNGDFNTPGAFFGTVFSSAGTTLGALTTNATVRQRFSLSATTTIYCTDFAAYATSTLIGGGLFRARRIR